MASPNGTIEGTRRGSLFMYDDEILREVHKIKEQLSAEFLRDRRGYWAEFQRIAVKRNRSVQRHAPPSPKNPVKPESEL